MSSGNSIGYPFIELSQVESTNNYAMGLIHAGMAQHGTAVFAHDQTKGKGQRDKQWLSKPYENIAISLIVKPFGLGTNDLFLFSMSVAIGVQQFFHSYAGRHTTIKWPNDVYWRDRKAGGILIENLIKGQEWKYAVVGIGLNINQTDFGTFNKAISLKQITGKTYDPLQLSKELLTFLEQSFKNLTIDEASVISKYHEHLYKWKEKVHLKKNNQPFEAIIKEVRKDGMLIVENDKEKAFKTGEIEWL